MMIWLWPWRWRVGGLGCGGDGAGGGVSQKIAKGWVEIEIGAVDDALEGSGLVTTRLQAPA